MGLALGIAAPAGAQPVAGGAFLDAQAASGRTAYGRSCASCHGAALRGAMHGPDLTGPSFLSNWGSQTAAALYEYLWAEMPPGLGGSLPSGTCLNIVAYLLQVNGHATGPQALTADAAVVVGGPGDAPARGAPATADASDAASADEPRDVDAVPAQRAFVNREVPGLTPVTDELLRNPPAEDWLTWRRTRDNHGYTPLDQIGPDNVAGLRLAWALASGTGSPPGAGVGAVERRALQQVWLGTSRRRPATMGGEVGAVERRGRMLGTAPAGTVARNRREERHRTSTAPSCGRIRRSRTATLSRVRRW